MTRHLRHLLVAACTAVCLLPPAAGAQATETESPNYVVGPLDLLKITVWNQEDLSGQYTVERDGTFTFPLVGRVDTRGRTLRDLEADVTRMLADGFLKKPQVSVSVVEYRSKRVFVVGELRQPGTYPLKGDTSLIEVLALAGPVTNGSADHVLIIRTAGARGPVLPGQDQAAEVIRLELKSLEHSAQTVLLRDGDTLYVPRALTAFVFGYVRNPGAYAVGKDTTVLQALSLAGGVTEYGAMNRIKIVRVVNGEQREFKVKLHELVQPGDTIVIPARYF